jgi:hypothetical protein
MFNESQLHEVEETSTPSTPPPLPKDDRDLKVDDTEIYYMPDNFRKNNHLVKTTTNIPRIWVLIISIILLLLLGGGLYVYWIQPTFISDLFGGKKTEPIAIPAELVPVVPKEVTPSLEEDNTEVQPVTSAKESYLAFRAELDLVTTSDQYLNVYSKYATSTKYEVIKNEKEQLELAKGTFNVLPDLRKKNSPLLTGNEQIIENITMPSAVLVIKNNNKEEGRAEFVIENDQWKLAEETWASSTDSDETGVFRAGTDTDQDGLTDEEETALGTNIQAADSDGDGYGDLAELNNDYNPTGAGKISENKSLDSYLNTTFNLSLLYPDSWTLKVSSTEDSIIMTAPDTQFIQVLAQPNTEREDILSWYKKTFSVENIPTSQLVTNAAWDGVRTPDGLTVYLTNKDKSFVFIVTYNTGNTRILNYRNIFELILRSLKIPV